jgi:hypothetical protein
MTRRLRREMDRSGDVPSLLAALGYAQPGAGGRYLSLEALMTEARHQADLLAHPYLGGEHVCLAAARLTDDRSTYEQLHAQLPRGLPKSQWRPRGLNSARRRHGVRETEEAQQKALQREEEPPRLRDSGAPAPR